MISFVAGVFIGAFIGVMVMVLCITAGSYNREGEVSGGQERLGSASNTNFVD